MSGEMIAIVAVGVALVGVILMSNRGLRQDMVRVEARLDGRIGALESRVEAFPGIVAAFTSESLVAFAGIRCRARRNAFSVHIDPIV